MTDYARTQGTGARTDLPTAGAPAEVRTKSETAERNGPADELTSRLHWERGYVRRAVALDALAAVLTAGAGAALALPGTHATTRLALGASLPALWLGALAVSHGYERRYLGVATEEYRAVVRSYVALVSLAAFLSYVAGVGLPNKFTLTVLTLLLVLGLLARHVVRKQLLHRRGRGLDLQRTVVVGNARSVQLMIDAIRRAPGPGMNVVAACVSGAVPGPDERTDVGGIPVFGYPEEAMTAVDLFDADVVAVASDPDLCGPELRRLAWTLEARDVDLVVSSGLFEVAGPRLSIRPVAGMPLLHVERPVLSGVRRLFKSAAEKLLTLLLVLVAVPLLAGISILVRLDSPGPVLFRQKRVGARGEEFDMFKFRTMCVDADQRVAQMRGAADAGNEILFKMRNDPRVTRVGKVLRRFSLDELPQLVNVLRGEMSLVGPRPPLPREVEAYEPDAVRRLRVRPGMTGLWQVSGRSELTWDESLRLDLWYVDNWSLVLDLQILARTARAVIKGRGAY